MNYIMRGLLCYTLYYTWHYNAKTEPILFYSKVPPMQGRKVVLLDPMLATGGSAKAAIRVLVEKGAAVEDITFLTVVSCPEGIAAVFEEFPQLRLVTGRIDDGLDEKKYIIPGLGDFGDRFYGTV